MAMFTVTAKSLIFQLVSAVSFLHDPAQAVAHRDLKPHNILIDERGCLKLIDFGIAWDKHCASEDHTFWPETEDTLYFDVSTGPYRAPELLFGTRNYNPYAIDLWSLGTVCAEFFTALKAVSKDGDDEDEVDGETDNVEIPPLIISPKLSKYPTSLLEYRRKALFDSSRGSIGLAWNIFSLRGTPTPQNWPTFSTLPDAGKVSFITVEPIPLGLHLPNLPPGDKDPEPQSHFPPEVPEGTPLDLIHRFLVYPPDRRLAVSTALQHPWFLSNVDYPLILPAAYPKADSVEGTVSAWDEKTLPDLLQSFLSVNS